MNQQQRAEAVANFKCPNCNERGQGIGFKEPAIVTYRYDAKKGEVQFHSFSPFAEEGLDAPEFEGNGKILCGGCGHAVSDEFGEDVFTNFIDHITSQYLERKRELDPLKEELAKQENVGLVQPGLNDRIKQLEAM